MAARDFPGSAEVIERVQKMSERLANLEQIAFAKEITTDYRISSTRRGSLYEVRVDRE